MPQVSVVIPTYKHRDYVVAAVDSVLAQTFEDYEIIVVNDGSPDDTAALLRPYIERGQIRYFEQPNAGQAAARNRGLAEAAGELIAFLDDDDQWPVDKLAWQVDALRRAPQIGAIAGDAELIDEGTGRCQATGVATGWLTFERLFERNALVSPGQVLVRRSVLDRTTFDPTIWGADDYDLWFRLARRTRVWLDSRVALHYRLHPGNASRDHLRMFVNCLRVIERNLRFLPAEMRPRYRRMAYRSLYGYAGHDSMLALWDSLWGCRWIRAAKLVHQLGPFLCSVFPGDPGLQRNVLHGGVPRGFRRAYAALRQR